MERSVAVFLLPCLLQLSYNSYSMSYYIRVLGVKDPDIDINELIHALSSNGLNANFEIDPSEQLDKWTVVDVMNDKGDVLAQIERNPVIKGEVGPEEVDELREEIHYEKPASAVEWLEKYFARIKVIYAIQMLEAGFKDGNFEILSSIKTTIWSKTGGILQADNEGFSNEDGDQILWQFSDTVEGEWDCAVRSFWGKWKRFRMDLGDIQQRKEFQLGKIPKNAIRL